MIKVSHVSKSFSHGKNAVNDLSFEVQPGETLVLLGTSGCGKTTTLRMINRLLIPDTGDIFIGDKNINTETPETLRRSMGYVLQNTGLFPHYTVLENIAVVPQLLGWDKTRIHSRALAILEKLRLPPATYGDVYPQQLSGGQQQRVGLARALAADPPILLMDEPFGALDPLTRISVRKEFKLLDELNSKTIILVTHDVEEAFELGNRICIMNEGRIQQLGSATELLFNPANDFVRHFLDKQRLELELKSLRLRDIWPYLDSAGGSTGTALPPDTSCWDTLEHLTGNKAGSILDGQNKHLDGNILITAINAYKKTVSQYGHA
ncbi:osmoprotectant transport system ATP-binding protein [Chitinophaga eiseniae]|uniref:Osmoprotectant transport system ATP-binding protein n=1 Tax=Chitinophaga eiseniae TaxID=634771 RepID=A0A1T4STR7_9BACT|nr:ATP-binding cassette domain-containing protein [Chitinophaga eiseniae]SKA31556.1 osmoprotectant transport system ATP-binding protein [Chitinophaga eiseniae]